jgi:tetratricopeptide (TPR) repeat protein
MIFLQAHPGTYFNRFRHAVCLILFSAMLMTAGESSAQAFSATEMYNTDSLRALARHVQGEALVDVYNKLAVSYAYLHPERCREFADKAGKLSATLGYKKGIADSEWYLGQMFMYSGDYPEAVRRYYNALETYEQLRDYYSLAALYYDFAKVHFYSGNDARCEENGMKALKYLEMKKEDGSLVGSVWDIAKLKSALGLLYRSTNRPEKAKEIYRWYYRIMNIYKYEITNRLVHTQLLARCFDETNCPDSAILFFSKTLQFPDENPSIVALKYESMRSMALIYLRLAKYPLAERYSGIVAKNMDKAGFLRQAFQAYIMLGDIRQQTGNPGQAEEFYQKALLLSDEMILRGSVYRYDSLKFVVSYGAELYFPTPENFLKRTIWTFRESIANRLSLMYAAAGEYQQAYMFQQSLLAARDTLNALARIRDILEIETKFETSRKEAQLDQLLEQYSFQQLKLSRSRLVQGALVLLIILLIIITLLLIRQQKIKASRQTAIIEQRLLRSQMNPHFIFNSLASIQDLILSKNTRTASDYLSRFAKMIRNILDSSMQEMVPVSREIQTIDNYLHLQKIRLEEKFDFRVTADDELKDTVFTMPSMMVQPFVENAIDHGIRFKQGKGMVVVNFSLEGECVNVSIEDNGVGRVKAAALESGLVRNHASVSTQLIQERLKILNRRSSRKISLGITDLITPNQEPGGTRVVLKIPV